MKLNTKDRAAFVPNAFVALIVGIHEELIPVWRKTHGVDGKAMILGGNVTPSRDPVRARNVQAAVTEF